MNKAYELDDDSRLSKRIRQDFNLYGINLNIKKDILEDDLIKYGRVK